MKQTFHSNGKLLITGEYLVLDGAQALAIPTSYGQTLNISTSEEKILHWKSIDQNAHIWFQEKFDLNDLSPSAHSPVSDKLSNLLRQARELNPQFLRVTKGSIAETRLDFPRDWGLGTSSTLVNNIAQWAGVDPYELLDSTFGGSGYDIAAAGHELPILYRRSAEKVTIKETAMKWEFTDLLFFVFLNKKQDSRKGIALYREADVTREQFARIDQITHSVAMCTRLEEFSSLLEEHERLISSIIGLKTVKERLFSDYQGTVKSLGAWGGDFVLATGNKDQMDYFRNKGYPVIIPFEKMIK